jgi:hypothetical protein
VIGGGAEGEKRRKLRAEELVRKVIAELTRRP